MQKKTFERLNLPCISKRNQPKTKFPSNMIFCGPSATLTHFVMVSLIYLVLKGGLKIIILSLEIMFMTYQ